MGIEMSFRDQRVGTSHLDRVKEDVSQEYFTCRNDLWMRVLLEWSTINL